MCAQFKYQLFSSFKFSRGFQQLSLKIWDTKSLLQYPRVILGVVDKKNEHGIRKDKERGKRFRLRNLRRETHINVSSLVPTALTVLSFLWFSTLKFLIISIKTFLQKKLTLIKSLRYCIYLLRRWLWVILKQWNMLILSSPICYS